MFDIISQIISYGFISRALVVGLLITVCSSFLGVTLVLKRYSMIGDGLSHISFGAVAVASVMGLSPMKVAIPVVIAVSIFLLRINGKKIKGDSAIAILSTAALAFGVMVISYAGSSADLNNYLIGSIYAIDKEDMVLSIALCSTVIILFSLFYSRIFAVTFDEEFAKATGCHVGVYNILIAVLTAVTVVIGMRLMGSLLISALIVFPAMSSMRVFRSFFSVTVSSVVISVVSFLCGFILTIFLDGIPTGACITLVNLVFFIIFVIIGKIKRN